MSNGTFIDPGQGITGGLADGPRGIKTALATLAAVAWYNALELIVLVFVTFREYHGLYFWSLLVSASVGLVPYSLGFLLKFFEIWSAWLSASLITVGWYCMVTGQSVVLYSRLHLVMRNQRILRRVLIMICVNAVILHIPTTVLTYGSNIAPKGDQHPYMLGYTAMEKIQMTGFCIQEFIISGLYIWETTKLLRLDPDRSKHKIMYQLIIINLIIILMDLGLLIVEYIGLYIMETMIKGVVYSIKLKLEFAVLGKLVRLVHCHIWKSDSVILRYHDHPNLHRHTPARHYLPDFVDATRVTTDLTHAPTVTTTATASTVKTRRPSTLPPAVAARRRSVPGMDYDAISIAMFEHSPPSRVHSHSSHSDIAPDDLEAHSCHHHNRSIQTHDHTHDHDLDASPSEFSKWSGDTRTVTNNSATTTTFPADFTESLDKQCSSWPCDRS